MVNDYGKDGPTNDAKKLLDKHIAEWAAQNGSPPTDRQEDGQLRAVPRLHSLRRAHLHRLRQCLLDDGKGSYESGDRCRNAEDGEAGVPPTPIRKRSPGHDKKTAKADAKPTATPPAAAALRHLQTPPP